MAEAQNMETEAPEMATENDAPTGTPESIGLQDLQLLAQIVDLSTQRGAFRGNELTQVGTVFDKLTSFLNHVAAEQQAKAEADGEEAPAEAEAEAPAEEPAE